MVFFCIWTFALFIVAVIPELFGFITQHTNCTKATDLIIQDILIPPKIGCAELLSPKFCEKFDNMLETLLENYSDLQVCDQCDSLWCIETAARAISKNEPIYVLKELNALRFHLSQENDIYFKL